ncbi:MULTISPECIES: putative cyclic bacteriocin [Staphylococcus]|uniref:Cyclic bacteriocin n=1 Tax=Staphylococcus hsinchuensis TaxID=3051183 RepID=A0ABZ3EAL7_9STAP|nr:MULTISPECIES: putative cyclic bacteriocin [unclassified Staphylococcus]
MMFELYKKIRWTGISKNTVKSFINALIHGNNIWTALQIAGVVFSGGVATAISVIGRVAIVKFVKRYGIKKAIAW